MPAPVITAAVALKTAAGSTALNLTTALAPPGYQLVSLLRPPINWRRRVQTGDFNPGEVELSSVRDVTSLALGVRVVATSLSNLETLYNALVTAACQGPGGQIAVTFGATTVTYKATGNPSVVTSGGRDGDVLRWNFREDFTITWPCDPYPT